MPDLDLQDAEAVQSALSKAQDRKSGRTNGQGGEGEELANAEKSQEDGVRLTPMIQSAGQLHVNENDQWCFHGPSSVALFVTCMRGHCGAMANSGRCTPFVSNKSLAEMPILDLSCPTMVGDSGGLGSFSFPPLEKSLRLCEYTFSYATCLLPVVHIPTFWKRFDDLYRRSPATYSDSDRRYLALLYAVLAIGCLYDVDKNKAGTANLYNDALQEGLVHQYSKDTLLRFSSVD